MDNLTKPKVGNLAKLPEKPNDTKPAPVESDYWTVQINTGTQPGFCKIWIPFSGTLVYNYIYGIDSYVPAKQLWIEKRGERSIQIEKGIHEVSVKAGDAIILQCYDPVYDNIYLQYNLVADKDYKPSISNSSAHYLENSWTLMTNLHWFGNLKGTYFIYLPQTGNLSVDYVTGLAKPDDPYFVFVPCTLYYLKKSSLDYFKAGTSVTPVEAGEAIGIQLYNTLTDKVCIKYKLDSGTPI